MDSNPLNAIKRIQMFLKPEKTGAAEPANENTKLIEESNATETVTQPLLSKTTMDSDEERIRERLANVLASENEEEEDNTPLEPLRVNSIEDDISDFYTVQNETPISSAALSELPSVAMNDKLYSTTVEKVVEPEEFIKEVHVLETVQPTMEDSSDDEDERLRRIEEEEELLERQNTFILAVKEEEHEQK